MTKEAVEDTKRHKADNLTNNQKALILNKYTAVETQFGEISWKDLQVGNVVKILNNQEIPADVVLLMTSEPSGIAYIETSNIDGETNLKLKNSCRTGVEGPMWSSSEELRSSALTIQCEQPNSSIHHFHGTLFVSGREIGVDASSLLLRGSSLRNTKYALGIVVYTGKESKLVMNSRKAPSKLSYIERIMNTLIYIIFLAQIVISLISLVLFVIFKSIYYEDLTYLCYNYSSSSNALFANSCSEDSDFSDVGYFVTFFILYNNFIPISLYVTVEVCNYFQAFFIDHDVLLYDAVTNTPALARTSNMNSDLGMVEYIFSDKTGTLTDNIMRFRRCSIGGVVYGDAPTDDQSTASTTADSNRDHEAAVHHNSKFIQGKPLTDLLNLITENEQSSSGTADSHSLDAESRLRQKRVVSDFVMVLALCHTVVLDAETGSYQSESPDEEALVKASALLGYTFVGRTVGKIQVQRFSAHKPNPNPVESFDLLATIPFDSTRKRMSVVVRRPDESIVVYCKGADNVMFARSSDFIDSTYKIEASSSSTTSTSAEESTSPKEVMTSHMDVFGSDGLRTLVLCKKELTQEVYGEFGKLYKKAEVSIGERDKLVAEAAAYIECDLTVLGATAIEDKLQQGVPQTIQHIHNAGIKLWVLTGDKMETAINIGYSARLLNTEMILIKLSQQSQQQTHSSKEEEAQLIRKKLETLLSHFQALTENKTDLFRTLMDIQNTITHSVFGMFQAQSFQSSAADQADRAQKEKRDKETKSRWIAEMIEHPTSASSGTSEDAAGAAMERSDEEAPLLAASTPSSAASQKADAAQSDKPTLSQLSSEHLALIVDGDTLVKILGDEETERLFLSLAMLCRSVIACRVSPEQKRLVVRLVKRGVTPTPVTLSIGDGANDVAMIQEAQIGVGISGKEGRQAVNSSDFAIAQFRFLKRLLLVHGRWDYRRICKVVVYSFYKNIVLTMVLFLFAFFSAYSGQSLFDDNIYAMYNIVLSLPVVAFGIFDRDISEDTLLKYNFLYLSGRKRLDLNVSTVLYSMLQAVIEAVIIFFVPYYAYSTQYDIWTPSSSGGGESDGLWVFGTAVYTYLLCAMFLRCALLTCTWSSWSHAASWASIALYFAFLLIYQNFPGISYNFAGVASEMFGSYTFWALFVLVLVASVAMETTIRAIRTEFFPTIVDIGTEYDAQQHEQQEGLKYMSTHGDYHRSNGSSNIPGASSGRSRSSSLFPTYDHPSVAPRSRTASLVNAGSTDLNSELSPDELNALQFSKALTGPHEKQRFSIDWLTLKGMFTDLTPREQEALGIHNNESRPAAGASFNYDHVSSEGYGPGAGNNGTTIE
eukprot:gene26144-32677_t